MARAKKPAVFDSGLSMAVEVKQAGGMTVTQRKLMAPLGVMAGILATWVRDRVVYKGRTHRGGNFGVYQRLVGQRRAGAGVRAFWTGPGLPMSRNTLNVDKEGRQLIESWGDYRAGVTRKAWLATKNFRFTGGLWRGLKTKTQASGKRITIGFLGSSKSKSGQRVSNRDKAWVAMSGPAGRGIHPLRPSQEELQSFAEAWRANVGPKLLRDLGEAAKLSKTLRAASMGKTNRALRKRLLEAF
jgi:hypothetical protein